MTAIATHPAAEALLASDDYRFTIREVGGRELRKLLPRERFGVVQSKYFGREVRVDVLDTRDDSVQTWSIDLGKYFGSN